jgi:hypothetical protein
MKKYLLFPLCFLLTSCGGATDVPVNPVAETPLPVEQKEVTPPRAPVERTVAKLTGKLNGNDWE